DQDVEALRGRDREPAVCDGTYGVTVGCDHAADEFAQIDPKLTGGRAIDDAEPDAAAALDRHDLRIAQCSIVGKEGVVIDIVQVHSHRDSRWLRHFRHVHAGRVRSHAGHAWFPHLAVAIASWVVFGL